MQKQSIQLTLGPSDQCVHIEITKPLCYLQFVINIQTMEISFAKFQVLDKLEIMFVKHCAQTICLSIR